MKLIYLLICTLLPIFAFGQSQEKEIADSICYNLSKLDLMEPPTILNQQAISAMQKVYQDFQPKSSKLIQEYRKKYPNKSDVEITKLVGQEVTVFLMDECVAYQRITIFNTQPVPKISETAVKVGKEFTSLLSSKIGTEKLSQSLIDDCVMQVIDKHSGLISKTYGNPNSSQFIKEFQAYLMTESIPYIRWMSSQIN